VDGVHPQRGITTYHANEVMIDRAMIAQAQKTLIVADHRKIGNIGFSHICNLPQCHALITDSSADPATLERIRQQGVEVLVATPTNG
jgi:DeoR family transcriptional regulator of aga operon